MKHFGQPQSQFMPGVPGNQFDSFNLWGTPEGYNPSSWAGISPLQQLSAINISPSAQIPQVNVPPLGVSAPAMAGLGDEWMNPSDNIFMSGRGMAGAGAATGGGWGQGLGDMFKSIGQFTKDTGMVNTYDAAGKQTGQGWGGMALGLGQGVMNGILGFKQLGAYKDMMNESKRQFQLNWDAQKQTTNTALEDRQNGRVAASPNAESTASYMERNRVRG